jgi:hypothetical protein
MPGAVSFAVGRGALRCRKVRVAPACCDSGTDRGPSRGRARRARLSRPGALPRSGAAGSAVAKCGSHPRVATAEPTGGPPAVGRGCRKVRVPPACCDSGTDRGPSRGRARRARLSQSAGRAHSRGKKGAHIVASPGAKRHFAPPTWAVPPRRGHIWMPRAACGGDMRHLVQRASRSAPVEQLTGR